MRRRSRHAWAGSICCRSTWGTRACPDSGGPPRTTVPGVVVLMARHRPTVASPATVRAELRPVSPLLTDAKSTVPRAGRLPSQRERVDDDQRSFQLQLQAVRSRAEPVDQEGAEVVQNGASWRGAG